MACYRTVQNLSSVEDGLLPYGPELVFSGGWPATARSRTCLQWRMACYLTVQNLSSVEDGLLPYSPKLVSSLKEGLLPHGPELVSSRLLSNNMTIKAYGSLIFPDVLSRCETCSVALQEEHTPRNFVLFISVHYWHSVR